MRNPGWKCKTAVPVVHSSLTTNHCRCCRHFRSLLFTVVTAVLTSHLSAWYNFLQTKTNVENEMVTRRFSRSMMMRVALAPMMGKSLLAWGG
jgi:hypothetical protein